MIGDEFTAVLRAAQHGDESAFVRLWRDANPVMVRYLRVVSTGDPYDIACESWITAIRGLSGFRGDEVAWRAWLFASARLRAEDEGMQRVWHAFEHADDLGAEELDEPLTDAEMDTRGLDATLRAIGGLPLAQGEILMLRLAGGLPTAAVAHIVGSDVSTVRVCERRALERLAVGAGLGRPGQLLDTDAVAWSLAADPLPAELADEGAALATLRAILPPAPERPAPTTLRLPLSRVAGIGAAAVGVGVFGLGGVSAAAYYTPQLLPHPVQVVMHRVIGAPSPTTDGVAGGADGRGGTDGKGAPPASAVGQPATGSALAAGLCRAWADDERNGVARDRSPAFRSLAGVAGGAERVESFCATALGPVSSGAKDPSATNQPVSSTTPGAAPTTTPASASTTGAPTTQPVTDSPTTGTTTTTTTTTTTSPTSEPTTTTTTGDTGMPSEKTNTHGPDAAGTTTNTHRPAASSTKTKSAGGAGSKTKTNSPPASPRDATPPDGAAIAQSSVATQAGAPAGSRPSTVGTAPSGAGRNVATIAVP